jgi:prepilin-type N-terminal cleavage/methylation domain-containing protein
VTRRRCRGLTLLEVLVASALLGVFFVSVYGLVSGTLATRAAIEETATPYAVGPVVLDRVVEDLRGALVEPYKDLDVFMAGVDSVNSATVTQVDFVTTVRSRSRVKVKDDWVSAALNEVGYRCRRSETESSLLALYRREDLGVDEEPLAGGKYCKLADRVKEFKVDWFAEDPGDPGSDEAKGEDEWDAKTEKKLPFGCRITIVIVGEAQGDDREALAQAPQYTFSTYLVFPSRFDKGEQQRPP